MDLSDIPCLVEPCTLHQRIVGIDQRVPVLDGSLRRYVNLDNAASTPVLGEVLDTVNHFMTWYASVHRGTGFKSRIATRAYEDARTIVAQFVGADSTGRTVIFGKNSTEAINKLAYRLPLQVDDVVLVSELEHHSNDLPWRGRAQVAHIGVDALGRLDEADFDRLLRKHAGRIKLVTASGGSNVTGHVPNVHRLAAKAHAAGAQILVDCAQLAPHRAIAIGELDDPQHLDYVVLSAHKMYAPFGTGALIGRRDTFAHGAPEYRGGGTVQFVSRDDVRWAQGPDRDEAGSPNVVGAVALAAAMQALQRIGMHCVTRHEAELTAHALQRLARIEGLRIYGDADPQHASQRLGVISFNQHTRRHRCAGRSAGPDCARCLQGPLLRRSGARGICRARLGARPGRVFQFARGSAAVSREGASPGPASCVVHAARQGLCALGSTGVAVCRFRRAGAGARAGRR